MKIWLVLAAIGLCLAGGGYWYWKHQAPDAPDYKTAPVSRGDIIQSVTATGQLNPETNITVGSQVSGIISKIYVDFNSEVTNHELVAEIDPSTYKALVSQAQGDLQSSQAAEDLAKAEEERDLALYTNTILDKSDYDAAVATAHQAAAAVIMKKAALDQALANLAYTSIYSPINGVVISRNVDVGQTVAASFSAPVLFMIANDLAQMQIDALVSEADIGNVETNQQVTFTVDAFPTRTFHGIVTQIRNAAQTNQNVISYDTVIVVDNSDLKLRPGMTATVAIITASQTNALKIPVGALRFRPAEAVESNSPAGGGALAANNFGGGGGGGGQGMRGQGGGGNGAGGQHGGGNGRVHGPRNSHTIYVLADGPRAGEKVPKPIQVRTGISDGIDTEIIDGLKEGDEVITGQILSAAMEQGRQSNPFGGGRRY